MTNIPPAHETVEHPPEFDPRDFRNALGHFGTGVTVITTVDSAGQFYGVTVSSFNSVSLTPPLVLWSQVRTVPSHQAFIDSEYFVVNILASDQKEISNCFARPSENKFQDISYHLSEQGIPVLNNTLAHFICKKERDVDGGDHLIFIGRVISYAYSTDDQVTPLFFWKGKYHSAADHQE
ncbi:MAG: flavin reductase family protein [Betaproteobacteria bacterium]|jgi:flavin reductase (DIM6/NTAB) family NADH-FMN oxidoreductase RutF